MTCSLRVTLAKSVVQNILYFLLLSRKRKREQSSWGNRGLFLFLFILLQSHEWEGSGQSKWRSSGEVCVCVFSRPLCDHFTTTFEPVLWSKVRCKFCFMILSRSRTTDFLYLNELLSVCLSVCVTVCPMIRCLNLHQAVKVRKHLNKRGRRRNQWR